MLPYITNILLCKCINLIMYKYFISFFYWSANKKFDNLVYICIVNTCFHGTLLKPKVNSDFANAKKNTLDNVFTTVNWFGCRYIKPFRITYIFPCKLFNVCWFESMEIPFRCLESPFLEELFGKLATTSRDAWSAFCKGSKQCSSGDPCNSCNNRSNSLNSVSVFQSLLTNPYI